MRSHVISTAAIVLATTSLALTSPAGAADSGDWITTWAASPQPIWAPDFLAPVKVPRALWNQTLREVASISLGGKQVRLVISNAYGTTPLPLGAAHVALAGKDGAISAGSDHAVTFDGQASVVVPPGAQWISDPVSFQVAPLSKLAVSLYFPGVVPVSTMHWEGRDTAFITAGNTTGDAEIKPASTLTAKAFLSGIMVDAPADARAVVTFGDSITDGDGSTVDATHRWPDFLARRLADAGGAPIAVVNEGISGARVRSDRMGVNALARFDRDVLSQPHVATVIWMMGINDIGWPDSILEPEATVPPAEAVIDGIRQIILRSHLHGLRILGATLTPFEDTFKGGPLEGYYNPEKEKVRVAVNAWIRDSGAFDGVIDFDALSRDPTRPQHIKAEYDSGDHLHPNDAAYQAMAATIDLGMLRGNR
jgi:lysophospholipase L1-like esterase